MFDDFLLRAALAGLGVALAAGPLGCFVVWRRMAYFGDATAHAAILGVALGLGLSIPVFGAVLATALIMAVAVTILSLRGYALDTLLGVLAHGALATGLVAVAFIDSARLDLMSYLFGDILTVGTGDLAVIWAGATAVVGLLVWRWSSLLISTLSPELAQAGGTDPLREQVILTLAMAVVVAVAIKVVGALLIGAMLVIPAAAARPLSRTPEVMAVLATGIGGGAVLVGLWAAYLADAPAGPMIVCAALAAFAVTNLWGVARGAG